MVTNPLFFNNNRYYVILWIIALAGLQVWGVVLYLEQSLNAAIIDSLISWLFMGGIVLFITNTLSYYHPTRGKTILALVMPLLLAYIWLSLTMALNSWIITNQAYDNFIDRTEFYRFSVASLIFIATTLISLIWYRLGEKEDLQRRKEETEKMVKDAELFKLRQQLQPHFLFNSLNSINSLIGFRPDEARTMIQQLSDFLRGTVKREDQKLIPLAKEIEYLNIYLQIEQVRFGHRLTVENKHEPETLDCLLPPLLIQPLLENAIKYGLYGTTGNITIQFKTYLEDGVLQIEITNPFDEDMQADEGTGFGLQSVRRRLYLLYGRKDLLLTSEKENFFTALLTIPVSYDKSTID